MKNRHADPKMWSIPFPNKTNLTYIYFCSDFSGKTTSSTNGVAENGDSKKKSGDKDKDEKEPKPPEIGLMELFKFSEPLDIFLMVFGSILGK